MSEVESSSSEKSDLPVEARDGRAHSENAAREPLPAGFKCVWCEYELSGSTSWRCPECGGELSEADFATVKRRRRVEGSAVRRAVLWGLLLVSVFLMTFGVLIFSRLKYWSWAPVWLLATLSLPVIFSSGVLASVLGRAGTRKRHLGVWTSLQGWLHAPWLLAVAGLLLLAPVAWLVRIVNIDRATSGFRGLVYVAVVFGAILSIALALSWKRTLAEKSHDIDLPAGAARACLRMAGWAMFVGSLAVGVCVGLLGCAGLFRLADA